MPEVYISQIDFGDGVVRTIKDPNASGGGSDYYIEQSVTLSTSSDTTVTFTDSKLTTESIVDVYTNMPNLNYTNMEIQTGSCTITYPKQSSAQTIMVRIYIR